MARDLVTARGVCSREQACSSHIWSHSGLLPLAMPVLPFSPSVPFLTGYWPETSTYETVGSGVRQQSQVWGYLPTETI